jgi:NADPH:quinone reductase-like Zn-dependent oxidoreductase
MQAIQYDRFGGPEVLRLTQVPVPEPGPGQVRVDLRAASVIPGDCKLRAGHLTALFPVTFPKIPGRDGAGLIGKVGPDVADVAVGAAVCVVAQHIQPGTYAESIVVDRDAVVPLPPNLTFEEGAALMHAGVCAWICLVEAAHLHRGMRVLIHGGAGAIGGSSIQLAHHLGAYVATTCSSKNVGYVCKLGVDEVIAYDRDDFSRALRDFDVVVDLIGGDVHDGSYSVLKRGGTMVALRAAPIVDRSREFGVRLTIPDIHDRTYALDAVVGLGKSGAVQPQICDTLKLQDAAAAHRRIEAGSVSRGRLVLQMA